MTNVYSFVANHIFAFLAVFAALIVVTMFFIIATIIGPRKERKSEVDRFSKQSIVRKQLAHALESRVSEKSKNSMALFLKRAGVGLSPGEYYLLNISSAVVAGIVSFAILNNLFVFFVGFCVGLALPKLVLRKLKQKRSDQMDKLAGEFLTIIIERTRNSTDFVGALSSVADHFKGHDPLGMELKRTVEDITRLGYSIEDALDGLDERCDNKYISGYVRSCKQARSVGTKGAFERLVGKNLENYHSDEKRASKLREKISSDKVEALIMVTVIPVVYFSQTFMFDWFFDFVLHTTMGQISTAIIMLCDLTLLWFTLFKVATIEE